MDSMAMDFLMDFLRFALPGGFLGGVVTWIAGRRKRNNDMLSQLQSSINMLSSENRKILDENINLRVENAELKANQEAMLMKLTNLTKEIERLRKLINGKERNAKERKSNVSAGRRAAERMRGAEDRNVGKDRAGGASGRETDVCAGQYGIGMDPQDAQGELQGADPDGTDDGGCAGISGIDGTDGGEPP